MTGETDGLATQPKRRGPRRKSESNEDRHPYLENKDGSAVPRDVLVRVGQKAWRLWQSLNASGLAPPSWGKASEGAYIHFNSEMLSVPEFEFFRYCEGNWKITRWATKAYASWAYNYVKSGEAGDRKTPRANKRKHGMLDDNSLLRIDDDDDGENIDRVSSHECSPTQFNSDSLTLPAPSSSTLLPTQVCPYLLYRCRAKDF